MLAFVTLCLFSFVILIVNATIENDKPLTDRRLKHFFTTRTDDVPFKSASTENLIGAAAAHSEQNKKKNLFHSKSFDDLLNDPFVTDSRYPPFRPHRRVRDDKSVAKKKLKHTGKTKLPRFMLNVHTPEQTQSALDVSHANAEISNPTNTNHLMVPNSVIGRRRSSSSFTSPRSLKKENEIPNFSRPLPMTPPSLSSRYSSITANILKDYQ